MSPTLAWWHRECNRETAKREQRRIRQFGLYPVVTRPPNDTDLPPEVWAWQAPAPRSRDTDIRLASPIRVGFAGHRPHAGHLGLARAAGALAHPDGTILAFDASGDGERRMVDAFQAALKYFYPEPPRVRIVGETPDFRRFQHQAARLLTLDRLRKIYGFDARTPLAATLDIADMLAFFLFHPDDLDEPGVALVDALQAPHSATLSRAARALGLSPPVLLYRRLFPHLRRAGERGSVRDPSSAIFLEDTEDAVRAKFTGAITGGRPSVAEQRAHGGDPTRCSAFATIELLCSPQRARTTLERCRRGKATCRECKTNNADAVVVGLRAITERLSTGNAGVSASVAPAVQRAVPTLYRPPPRESTELEAAIAARVGTSAEQVVAANGSTEAMDWLYRHQSQAGAQVAATEPAFELHRDLAQRHGFEYVPVNWDPATFAPSLPAVEQAIGSRTRLVVVELPHSVSGATVPLDTVLTRIAPTLPTGARVLLDLAYADFMEHPPRIDADLLEAHPELVVCGTLSKAHCLLGARVGYALTAKPLASRLRRQRLPYGLDALTTAAARAALDDEQRVQRTLAANRTARARLSAVLAEHGITYVPSQANFLLLKLTGHYRAVVDRLQARNTRYRDGHRWGLPGWIQVHLIDVPTVAPVIDAIESAAPGQPRPLCGNDD